jgi:NitT/TauT family transport system substrate-binding protein
VKKLWLVIPGILALLSIACIPSEKPTLKIVTNSWIGYSPLFYARQKGLLELLNIKLVNVVSLGESRQLYETGVAMAFTGTQYEFFQSYQKDNSLMPVIMFDRSNGGDMVMSNRTIDELKASSETLQAYLEMDSINRVLLEDFLQQNDLINKSINYHNKDQAEISTLKNNAASPPIIIATYIPYNRILQKQGFKQLASTRGNSNLLVIDALYTSQQVFKQHKQQFIELKAMIDESIASIKTHPKDYYEQVKAFIDNPGYDEFLAELNDIAWINKSMDSASKEHLKKSGFPVRDLLQ